MFAFVARRSVRRPLSTASRIGAASPRQPALRAHSFPYLRSNIPALSVCRVFRHLAQNTEAPSTPTKVPVPPTEPRQATPVVTEQPISRADEHPTAVEQRRRDWAIIKQLVPHIWPKHDWGTKGRVLVGLGFLIAGKVLNVQVPLIFKNIVDALNLEFTADETVWVVAGSLILGYGTARAGAALFGELLNAVFASVGQRAVRKVARETFAHILDLDLKFHLTRQTGGLTRAIDRGTKGITFLLQAILFRVVPTALEISLVCGILTYNFGWNFAAITLATMGAYTWFTVRTTSWRTRFRREANQADNRAATVAVDSLLNFEAVKHFGNEAHAVAQYDSALASYERSSVKIATSLAFLNSGQNVIFSAALTGIMLLAAQGVVKGEMSVGELVMANQLVFQLSLPLNFLGTIYRELRQSLTDMDTLFALNAENRAVMDKPNAPPLALHGGAIEFRDVHFAYDPVRPILRGCSFTIPAGARVALVGPSGCGKSTAFRLLGRFYETTSGAVLVDGQDVRDVQLASLRTALGVVPQDTPLFHADVRHNIRYGRLDATDAEVEAAAASAQVHDAIMRLPKGYATTVGERGLLLSGGEKQRLAVARVVLRDARIVLFDEATSALDGRTEAELMSSIRRMLKDGQRTSVFVAHRLRTVVDADLIIVLQEGRVAEQGTHDELMAKGGLYHTMWIQQNVEEGPVAVEVVAELEEVIAK